MFLGPQASSEDLESRLLMPDLLLNYDRWYRCTDSYPRPLPRTNDSSFILREKLVLRLTKVSFERTVSSVFVEMRGIDNDGG